MENYYIGTVYCVDVLNGTASIGARDNTTHILRFNGKDFSIKRKLIRAMQDHLIVCVYSRSGWVDTLNQLVPIPNDND